MRSTCVGLFCLRFFYHGLPAPALLLVFALRSVTVVDERMLPLFGWSQPSNKPSAVQRIGRVTFPEKIYFGH